MSVTLERAAGGGPWDLVILGAGIVGTLAAREFSRYELSILVIDAESDIGMGASCANSAIIHAGYDPEEGSMKARLNVEGARLWDSVIPSIGVEARRTGSYVVALGESEHPALERLYRRGAANGVPGLALIGREELLVREPFLNPLATGALYAPSARVIDPFGAVWGAAEHAALNGVRFAFGIRATGFEFDKESKLSAVRTDKGIIPCRFAINCAGLGSAELMRAAEPETSFAINPRRGEYLVLDPALCKVNNVLFAVPTEKGKGILVSTTTHGNVMLGPNAVPCEPGDASTTREGEAEVVAGARRLVPSIDPKAVIARFAGIRASGNLPGKDFLIKGTGRRLVHTSGIDSPGFAAAPAIALELVDLLREEGLTLREKAAWVGARKVPISVKSLSHKERAALVSKQPEYGRVVCRCEEVTEGEVLDALRCPVPATNYDGVKRRTWLGTGRCQGGFDRPRLIQIVARELGIPVEAVTKRGPGSELLARGPRPIGGAR